MKSNKLEKLSNEKLAELVDYAEKRLNEIKLPWSRKNEHPSKKRVGDVPQATGKDHAMKLVSQAYRSKAPLSDCDEKIVVKYPETAYYYASRVMKDRWRDAEGVIRNDPEWWGKYKAFVKKLPDHQQRYKKLDETVQKNRVLKEATQVKDGILNELRKMLWNAENIQTKLTSDKLARRFNALGGETMQRYNVVKKTVDSLIDELRVIASRLDNS